MMKKGVSGGKLVAALFTFGISMLFLGLSRKEAVTLARCANCGAQWSFWVLHCPFEGNPDGSVPFVGYRPSYSGTKLRYEIAADAARLRSWSGGCTPPG
jgi:hypothetical protein